MLHVALLAAVLSTASQAPTADNSRTANPIVRCLSSMDGAIYHGDPSDRALMNANVAACESALGRIRRTPVVAADGPGKLFFTARLLDRAATLSFMGLGDVRTALREVRQANLYFRIASGLAHQSDDFTAAASANTKLTALQLHTLRAESPPATMAQVDHPSTLALHTHAVAGGKP